MSKAARPRVKMNALDKAIAAVSPQAGLSRMNAKAALSLYQAPNMISRTAGSLRGTLANWLVSRTYKHGERLERETISDRSQDLVNNDPHAASAIDSMALNIAGVGLSPQSTPYTKLLGLNETQAADFQESAEWAFSLWSQQADVCGRMSFWAIQHLCARSILNRGEFVTLPVMLPDKGRDFSLALQTIDPMRLFTPSDKVSDDNVREGVEFSGVKPAAYWISNPPKTDFRYSMSSGNFSRIPAQIGHRPGVLHGFVQKDLEQVRGVGVLAPAMKFFRDLSDYLDFELVGAIVAASFPIFVESGDPFETARSLDGYSKDTTTGEKYQEVTPGQVLYGLPGQKPHVLSPNRPGNTFPDFVERLLRAVGASVGMPYEIIAKDFSKTNYSSARAALLEAWRVFTFYQKWLVDLLCRPVWEMVLEEAWLRGMLILPSSAPDWYDAKAAYTRAIWIPPKRGHVDPVKEMDALVTGLENNLLTLADAAAEMGGDWESRLQQRARERELEKKLGIEPVKKGLPAPTKDKSDAEDGKDGQQTEN